MYTSKYSRNRPNSNTTNFNSNNRYIAVGPHIYRSAVNSLTKYYRMKCNLKALPNITFTPYRTDIPNDINFTVITVSNSQGPNNRQEKVIQDLISCAGFELDGHRTIIMEAPTDRNVINDIFNHMYDQNDYILEKHLFTSKFKGILNLSNFNHRFNLKLSFNEKGNLNFVLFLCARHSYAIEKDVRIIDFRNNNLNSLIAFLPSRKIFPNLETIIVEGNEIFDNSYIFNEITATGVSIQQSTGGFVKYQYLKAPEFKEPEIELPPPELATNKNEGQEIEIFPSEFVANPFLIAFLKQSGENMNGIIDFYEENAIMSLTSEPAEDLKMYRPFTRSLKNGRNNFVQGRDDITEFNIAVFGQSVHFKITKIQACEVIENGYMMVLHGCFVNENEKSVGFDRTLFIGREDDTFMITNDQIHLRSFDE